MEGGKNEGVANVQQNTSNERTRIQHPTGIKNIKGKPKHDTQVLGDVTRRIRTDIQSRESDDGFKIV